MNITLNLQPITRKAKQLFRLPVFTETSPNMQWDDIFVVLRIFFTPWTWKNKKYSKKFEEQLKDYTGIKHVVLTDSGRTSLNLILQSLGIKEGDEVILPSFTCLVVANAVRWTGATPVYLDTNEKDFNANYENIADKITEKTKAILVQHTFGKMVNVDKIRRDIVFASEAKQTRKQNSNDLNSNDQINSKIENISHPTSHIPYPIIIEDLAHTLKRNQELQGDVGFLTFGIEKMFSTIRGGAIVTNDEKIAGSCRDIVEQLQEFPNKRTLIGLLNPLFWWVDVPLHKIGYKKYTLGAAVRIIWRKLGFLGIMIEKIENRSIKPNWYPAKISPGLCQLGIHQLKKLDKYNEHRSKIAKIYHEKLGFLSDEKELRNENSKNQEIENRKSKIENISNPTSHISDLTTARFDESRIYLRYPILLRSEEEKSLVWETAKSLKVTLGAWFKSPLYATYVTKEAFDKLCFVPALTPMTVKKCSTVLNLPTGVNISEKRARELADNLNKIVQK